MTQPQTRSGLQAGPDPVVDHLTEVRARIAAAARAVGRDPESVTLVAVSKTFGPEAIEPVIAAGQRVFGENRVQEAKTKFPALREAHPGLELHLIGPLQSNKAKEAVALFDVIQSVDRDKIAEALAREMERQGRRLRLYAQVNTGREPQKAGLDPDAVIATVTRWQDELGLAVEGLMAIPPADEDPAPHFRQVVALADQLGLPGCSMGMSGDFEIAIREGATMVRVGSAIFGARPRP